MSNDAFSIARKVYRNQLFVLPVTLMIPYVGPFNLTGYKLEMLIGQPATAASPYTVAPAGAPSWWFTPAGLPGLEDRDISLFPPDNIAPPTCSQAWSPKTFGTVLFSNATPTGNLALGQAIFSWASTITGQLIASNSYNWIVLVQPPAMDASPMCGGPLLVRDAPLIV
jgi:hypothetical protein